MKDIKLYKIIPNSDMVDITFDGMSYVSNINNLLQKIIKRILTIKGSNSFIPDYGSGFLEILGNTDTSKIEDIKELVDIMLEEQIIKPIKNEQFDALLKGQNFDEDELLETITVDYIQFDEVFLGWVIYLLITTQSSLQYKIRII